MHWITVLLFITIVKMEMFLITNVKLNSSGFNVKCQTASHKTAHSALTDSG